MLQVSPNARKLTARMGVSPAVRCSAWLAEPRFLLAYMAMTPLRCLPYSTTDRPLARAELLSPQSPPLAIKAPRDSRRHSGPADRAVWPQRSGDQAASFGLDPRAIAASCEAIRRPDHGTLDLELPAPPRSPPESRHRCVAVFVGAEGPKHLLRLNNGHDISRPCNKGYCH